MPGQVSTLTFLYTDIEGSTKQWEQQPEAMRAALSRHDVILRQAIADNGGHLFRTAGDAFSASFTSAPEAIAAAVQAQRALFAENWPLKNPILVRIALHTGLVEENQGDFVGSSLNYIGRLLSVCHGGQTVLTLVTQELIRDQLPKGVNLLDLGQHRFRDLPQPERIYQLVIDGLPDRFPPLKSLDLFPNNLQELLSSFIGRKNETAEIIQLLSSSRLVTLTGPGGTGKTRLSLQAAREVLTDYPDGVWMIELAPISNPGLIVQSIAMVLNIHEQPGRSLQSVLFDALLPKKLLLILDNCEHLIEACAQVVNDLLRTCPDLKILTSSREMLGISGEQLYRVPPLSLPNPTESSFEELAQSESVRLFVERASAVQPHFLFNQDNAPAIAQICKRLDGIPLAIELAAARSALFNPSQIAARLDDRFRLLTGGSRTALPRQQTLEALFDWSYDLLSAEERIFLRRISVFAGSWSFEAAEAIYLDKDIPDTDQPDVIDLLSRLFNKSLVVADQRGQSARYRMLETTRQYAQKKLFESNEAPEIRRRHMVYYAKLSKEVWQSVQSFGTRWTISNEAELIADIDNLRMAQEWALENALETALLFCGSLFYLWGRHGLANEMHRFVREVLKRAGESSEFQGECDQAYCGLLAGAWTGDALLSLIMGKNEEGLQASHKAVEQARFSGDPALLSFALSVRGEAAGLTGNVELAHSSSEESITTARLSGNKWILGMALINTAAYALFPLGEYERAKSYVDEGIQIFRSLNDPYSTEVTKIFVGMDEIFRGDAEAAMNSFSQALAGLQIFGDPYSTTIARSGLADAHRQLGHYDSSRMFYLETIKAWRGLGNPGAIARCLECLGFIAISQCEGLEKNMRATLLHQAAVLFGNAEAIRKENNSAMNPVEQAEYNQQLALLREITANSVSERTTIEKSWATGKSMGLDQIISFINFEKTYPTPPAAGG